MSSHLIAPSILSADFANLQRDVEMINQSQADWIHADIMDGRFVPNLSFGLPVLKAISKHAKKPVDVHLMIVEPEKYLKQFQEAGAYMLTVHLEASIHLHRTVQEIHGLGMKAGVAINPHTSITLLQDMLPEIDLICLMSVNPGFGGQKFISGTYDKIKALKQMILACGSSALIEIDGGVDLHNKQALLDAGADVLVAGNTVFSAADPQKMIEELKK